MAISDQSIYNTYIARSLTKNDVRNFTVGTMPEEVSREVEEMVAQSIADNSGRIPKDLYGKVADKIRQYVPGMERNALASVLKANGIFGLTGADASVKSVGTGLEKQRNLYQQKQNEIQSRSANQFSTSEDEGLLPSAARTATSTTSGAAPDISGPDDGSPKPPPYEVAVDDINATGTFVSSVEELEYEMGSADRDISEMIIHWSETFQNANLTGSEVRSITGAGDKEYHYIIKRDGSIERGVPITRAGNHTRGHNSYSIGVCLVGGMKHPIPDVNTLIDDFDLYEKGAESLTRSQYNSLYQLFRVFFTQYPGGQALGHSEIENTEDDPGFEVRDYVYNLFNKQSLYLQPDKESEKSPDEILAAIDGEGTTVNDKDNTLLDQKF